MTYDTDKQELLGDKDTDIVEKVHTSDLNAIPTGKDITSDVDLNVPPGPDREIDTSLANILDYFAVDVTCLSSNDSCLLRYWTLDGTRTTSRRIESGDTQRIYWRKDNPSFDITDRTLGLNSVILQQQISGENDGLFEKVGYMRFEYIHPAGKPTEEWNNETPIGADYGCTDPDAFNYNPSALYNDGGCIEKYYGCTDPIAENFDYNANTDDGSCYGIG